MGVRWTRLLCVALALGACAQPRVLRDGVPIPYERAAESDLRKAQEHVDSGQLEQARQVLEGSLAELPSSRRADEALFLLGEVQVELGEPETLRVLDDHHRGIRDVDADFDHGRGDENLEGPFVEPLHNLLFLS